jgi:integrase
LSDSELAALWRSCQDDSFGRIVRLLLLSALRAQPRHDGTHVFGRYRGFASWSTAMEDLRHRFVAAGGGKADFSLHDLRRSAATRMAELGVQPHIIEALLNHVSGHKRGTAGIYNRASYEREKAAALKLWAETLLAAVENRPNKVTPLRRA